MRNTIRRPSGTPALGVPDIAWAEARAAAAGVLVSNLQWVNIAAKNLTNAMQVFASITMVAKATGRFRGRLTGYITNGAGASHAVTCAMNHGAGNILTFDYVQIPLQVPQTTLEGAASGTLALIVDFPANGFTAVKGSSTVVNVCLQADANGALGIGGDACQFELQEY